MRRRRILIVTRPGSGGAARHVQHIASHLDRARFDLTIVASPLEDPGYPARLRELGATVLEVPIAREPAPLLDALALIRLAWIQLRGGYDVIHAHTTKPGALARVVALLTGAPRSIYTPHGFYHTYDLPPRRRQLYRDLETALARMGDAIIALTRAEAAEAARMAPGRVHLLPNAIARADRATPEERSALRRELQVGESDFVAALVGRVEEPKQPEVAIDAVQILARRGVRVVLAVVGGGRDLEALRRRAESVAPSAVIRVLGPRDDAPLLQAAADVAILSSRSEGMPYVLLEAAAAGVPAVASDLPGCREVVVDQCTGILYPVGDADRLAAALARLRADADLARALGDAAQQRVRDRHDLAGWARGLAAIYSGCAP